MTPEIFAAKLEELTSLQPTLDNADRGCALAEELAGPLLAMLQEARDQNPEAAQQLARWIAICGNFFQLAFDLRDDIRHSALALKCYDISLEVWTKQSEPLYWATSQMNRANALRSLGDRQGGEAGLQALREAIKGYDASLEVRTKQSEPLDWAASQMNRANALTSLGECQGGEAGMQALRQAIEYCDASLEVWTKQHAPLQWAMSQVIRANAFSRLGERQGSEAGVQALREAIQGYDASLEVWTKQSAPLQWATSQMNRAVALETIGERRGGEAGMQALREAVKGYDASLEVRTKQSEPLQWARSQMNRANVISILGERQGGEAGLQALREAVKGYDASLEVRTKQSEPLQWARSQMNRATALRSLGERQVGEAGMQALRDAVKGYDASLEVWTKQSDPLDWATSQMNRANALSSLGERQGGEAGMQALRDAVEGYDASLEVRTKQSDPLDWATSQMNRAVALMTLGERQVGEAGLQALRDAVKGHDASLEVRTKESDPLEWAMSQMNRANALQRLGERQGGEAGLQALREAVKGYDASLEVRTKESAPMEWAMSQMNRANALQRLGERQGGEAGLQALRDAVKGFDASLEVRTKESAPMEWAMSQMNRANALQRLGERQVGKAGRSILRAALTTQLSVLRLSLASQDALWGMRAARAGLPLAMGLKAWPEALEAGEALLAQAPEALLTAQTDADRKEVYQSLQFVADRTAIAMAHTGEVAQAALKAEQGRARALREHFEEAQAALSEDQRRMLAIARDRFVEAKAQFTAASTPETPEAQRSAAYAELDEAHAAFSTTRKALGLDAKPIAGDLWRRAAPVGGAAVVFALTPEGAAAFILPHAAAALTERHALMLPDATTENLNRLLLNEQQTGWLNGYADFYSNLDETHGCGSHIGVAAWSERIEAILATLDVLIMGPLSQRLTELGLPNEAPIALIAPGILANLPLHAAGKRENERWRCFLDRWTPSYAPSLVALSYLHGLPAAKGDRLLAITDPSLDFPDVKNPALAHYPNPIEYHGRNATQEAVLAALPHVDCVSALCHGVWSPGNPENSGLIMAHGKRLTLAQIKTVKMTSAALIALLACETAPVSLGEDRDELENLPLGLIQAGARGVTATFWPVFGHVADGIMADFFARHRRLGHPPAAAMRAATLAMRDGAVPISDEALEHKAAAFYGADGAPHKTRIFDEMEEAPASHSDALLKQLKGDFTLPIHWAVYGYFGM